MVIKITIINATTATTTLIDFKITIKLFWSIFLLSKELLIIIGHQRLYVNDFLLFPSYFFIPTRPQPVNKLKYKLFVRCLKPSLCLVLLDFLYNPRWVIHSCVSVSVRIKYMVFGKLFADYRLLNSVACSIKFLTPIRFYGIPPSLGVSSYS